MRGLGYVADIPDSRDIRLGVGGGGWPTSATVDHVMPPVLDQGQLNSCVAHGVAQAVYASHVMQGYVAASLCSRLFLYNLTRAYEHTLGDNVGVSIRDCIGILNWFGFCPEDFMPYDDNIEGKTPKFKCQPSPKAFRAAFDQRAMFPVDKKPARYHRIDGSGGEMLKNLRGAVCAGFPVVFGVDVDEAFVAGDFDPGVAVGPPSQSVGGHCMVVTGYDNGLFRVRNSWGSRWGDAGSCWLSSEYMLQSVDKWTVEHAPKFSSA